MGICISITTMLCRIIISVYNEIRRLNFLTSVNALKTVRLVHWQCIVLCNFLCLLSFHFVMYYAYVVNKGHYYSVLVVQQQKVNQC